MSLHSLFTEDGIPAWIGSAPIEGSEMLPDQVPVRGEPELVDVTIPFLAAHLRTAAGDWVPRPPPPAPTAEDLSRRQAEADRQRAEIEAQEAQRREEEIVRRAGPDQLLRAMGKITIAELTARVAAIRAEVEAGQ